MLLLDYIRDTKGEMKHVSWPTKNQAIGYTAIVLVLSIVLSIYLGFFDFIFTRVMDAFFISKF
jgi:preprotein translocase subunit SecE